jgi:dTDP-4-dehydrorhamnose reductase
MSHKGKVPSEDEFRHESPLRFRRVMVVGASGYVGSALSMGLRDDFDVFATHHKSPLWIEGVHAIKLDCMSANDILTNVQRYRPDVVIYCAGIASAATCHENPMIADTINNRAMTLFFKVLPRPIPFVYISCDQVFSSTSSDHKFRFTEEDDPNPLSELAQSKTRGESLVMAHNRLTYVMRLARVYGERLGSPQRPRESWVQRIVAQTSQGESCEVLEDQLRSSLYIGDVVRALRKFLKRAPLSSTLFHLSANDSITELESAQAALTAWNIDTSQLRPITLDTRIAAQGFIEGRNSAMSSKRFQDLYEFRFQPLSEGLMELRARLETGYTQAWV